MTTVRIAGVVRESIVDGPGIRFVVFTQGCPHACPGCHNPQSHDGTQGYDCDIEKIINEIHKNPLITGVTFSGGEPMLQPTPLLALAKKIKLMGKHLMIYTGYTAEELLQMGEQHPDLLALLRATDILIDGRYLEEERSLSLLFRGSKNQRVLDAKALGKQGVIKEVSFHES